MADVELKLKGVVVEITADQRRASEGSLPNLWSRKPREGQDNPTVTQKAISNGKQKKPEEVEEGRGAGLLKKGRHIGEHPKKSTSSTPKEDGSGSGMAATVVQPRRLQ